MKMKIYHPEYPGNPDEMQTLTNEINCITNNKTSLKGLGKKEVDINNFRKQCFDWIL